MTKKILQSTLNSLGIVDAAAAVAEYAGELSAWRSREALVDDQDKTPLGPRPDWKDFSGDIEAFQSANAAWEADSATRYARFRKPVAYVDIEEAVDANGNPDFVVEDDSPSADEVASNKKANLLIDVLNIEKAERTKVLPAGKQRLLEFQIKDARARDTARVAVWMADLQKEISDKNAALNSLMADPLVRSEDPADAAAKTALADNITTMRAELSALIQKSNDVDGYIASSRPAADQVVIDREKSIVDQFDKISRWAAMQMSDIEDLATSDVDGFSVTPFSG